MTDSEKLERIRETIFRMRNSLARYPSSETRNAKLSVLRVIEGAMYND